MTNFGIIGGVGPMATSRLYNELVAAYKRRHGGQAPGVFIHSLPVDYELECNLISGIMDEKYVTRVKQQLTTAFHIMQRVNPEVIMLACNTLTRYSRNIALTPFKNPIDAVEKRVAALGLKKIGILATSGTRRMRLFDQHFSKIDVSCVYPGEEQQATLVNYILSGLEQVTTGGCDPQIAEIVKDLSLHCDGIILGCTDLFPLKQLAGEIAVPIIDSLDSLIQEAIQEPIEERIQEPMQEVIQESMQEPIQGPIQKVIQEPMQEVIQEADYKKNDYKKTDYKKVDPCNNSLPYNNSIYEAGLL